MYSLEDRSFCLHQLDLTDICLRRDQRDSDAHRNDLRGRYAQPLALLGHVSTSIVAERIKPKV